VIGKFGFVPASTGNVGVGIILIIKGIVKVPGVGGIDVGDTLVVSRKVRESRSTFIILVGTSSGGQGVQLIELEVSRATIGIINIKPISGSVLEGFSITTETDMGSGSTTKPPARVITTVGSGREAVLTSLEVATILETGVEELESVVNISIVPPFTRLVLVISSLKGLLSLLRATFFGAGNEALPDTRASEGIVGVVTECVPLFLVRLEGSANTERLVKFTLTVNLQTVGVVINVEGLVLLAVLDTPNLFPRVEGFVRGVGVGVGAGPARGGSGGVGLTDGVRANLVRTGNIVVRVAVAARTRSKGTITAAHDVTRARERGQGRGTTDDILTSDILVVVDGSDERVGTSPVVIPFVITIHTPCDELLIFPKGIREINTSSRISSLELSP